MFINKGKILLVIFMLFFSSSATAKYEKLFYDFEIKSINGGYLIQEKNNIKLRKNHIKSVSNNKASKKILDDLIFCFDAIENVTP